MLKFSATNRESGLPVLGIGLSRLECDRLLDGEPIEFSTATMPGMPVMEVAIFAGETESVMTDAILKCGALTPEQILEDSTLADPFARRHEPITGWPLPDPGYACGAAYCDDPACTMHNPNHPANKEAN